MTAQQPLSLEQARERLGNYFDHYGEPTAGTKSPEHRAKVKGAFINEILYLLRFDVRPSLAALTRSAESNGDGSERPLPADIAELTPEQKIRFGLGERS